MPHANQPPPLDGYDLYGANRPLVEAVEREGAAWADGALRTFGALLGGEPLAWGRVANELPPRLRTHDRFGERIDEVEFHPAWHELLRLGVSFGLHLVAVARAARGRARCARGGVPDARAGRGRRRLSAVDDVRRFRRCARSRASRRNGRRR